MDPPERPPANEVGDAFVEQYYLIMESFPEQLHRVYNGSSRIGRPGENGRMRYFTLADKDENLNVLLSGGYESAEVTSILPQDSLNGSVFLTVGGCFTSNERPKRNFTQCFFLAPQENGYFVLNDMFRFDDDKPIRPANNVIEEKFPETEVTRNEVADGSKKSDASVVMKAIPKGQVQHSSCDPFSEIKADAVYDTGFGNNQESQALYDSSSVYDTGYGSNLETQAFYDPSSVYVKNLPPKDTYAWVEKAFSKFGPIKRVEIRNPNMDYYYGFVEFKDANAAERAIKASPVRTDGQKVLVGKKRIRGHREKLKIYEEERRQHSQNRFRSEHLRGTGVYDFWDWVETMEEYKRQEEERGTRDYDFWDWQRSMDEQSKKLQEEVGGTGVDLFWDYEQVMEEYRKFQEESRKLDEEKENQN